jgi:Flp pilus assembly protein TadD
LGLIQLNTGSQTEAKQSQAAAVTLDPNLWRARNGQGLIVDKNGDYLHASQYYESALKTKPKMPMLMNNLGYSKYLSGIGEARCNCLVQYRDCMPSMILPG